MRRLTLGLMVVLTAVCVWARTHQIKTNTATKIVVGPFYDGTDHETPETGLTVGDIDCELAWDNGGTPVLIELTLTASDGDNDCAPLAGSENGLYTLELTAANVNYLGTGTITFRDPNNTFDSFVENLLAVPANHYDSLIAGTDRLNTNIVGLDEDGTATEQTLLDLIDFADYGYDPANNGVNVWTIRGDAPLSGSDVKTQTATALSDIYLDHLMASALTDPNNVANNSILAKLVSATAAWATFASATDSFEAIADSIIPPPSGGEQEFSVASGSTLSAVVINVTGSVAAGAWRGCLVRVYDSGEGYGAYSRVAYNTAADGGTVTLYLDVALPFADAPESGAATVYLLGWGVRQQDIPRGRL